MSKIRLLHSAGTLILALSLILSLTACGGTTNKPQNSPETATSASPEVSGVSPDDSSIQGLNSQTAIGDIVSADGYDWLVLDVQDGKALIISEDIIGIKSFYDGFDSTNWETSNIREYLNGEFYDGLSSALKTVIVETQVSTPDNPWFGTSGGGDTIDRIFLLSLQEVVQYFGDSGSLENWDGNSYYIDDEYNTSRQAKLNLTETQIEN